MAEAAVGVPRPRVPGQDIRGAGRAGTRRASLVVDDPGVSMGDTDRRCRRRRPAGLRDRAVRTGGDRVELAECRKANERRNDPSVDGAYARAKTRPIPPCRSKAMSSMLSAPATIPASSEATFKPAFAPLSPGTVRCSPANLDRPGYLWCGSHCHRQNGPPPDRDIRESQGRFTRCPV